MSPALDKSIMIYVQHLLGTGHLQRSAQLANEFARQGFVVDLISGGMPVSNLVLEQVNFHQLPALRSIDSQFKQLVDEDDHPVSEDWKKQRCNQLLSLFENIAPHVVITETFPFGRRMMRFELVPLLNAIQKRRKSPLLIASIRDILQPKSNPQREREILAFLDDFYDRVLVHGDDHLAQLSETFTFADQVSAKTCYSGYICNTNNIPMSTGDGDDEVIVSAGGGSVGLPLLKTAIAAKSKSKLSQNTWRLLVGHNISQANFDALIESAGKGIIVERNRSDFSSLLSRSAVSISQAGYNTSMDILSTGARAVMIPFTEAGEREQDIRADLLQQHGRVVKLDSSSLNPALLAEAVNKAYKMPLQKLDFKMDGAKVSASLVKQWLLSSGSDKSINPWESLHRELDIWSNQNRTASFWWRDDDATEDTSELRRLNKISENLGVPLGVASIPSRLKESLSEYLRGKAHISVLQHGYAHESFAAKGEKKIELGGLRSIEDICAEMKTGRELMQEVFSEQFIPVLVPPWNRIDESVYPMLVKAGFTGLSSMWARAKASPVDGLLEVNTHLDPVNWRTDRGFVGDIQAIDAILKHLRARRTGLKDSEEPTGILTHHLSQDEAVWEFFEKLLSFLNSHPAVKWLDAHSIWQQPG